MGMFEMFKERSKEVVGASALFLALAAFQKLEAQAPLPIDNKDIPTYTDEERKAVIDGLGVIKPDSIDAYKNMSTEDKKVVDRVVYAVENKMYHPVLGVIGYELNEDGTQWVEKSDERMAKYKEEQKKYDELAKQAMSPIKASPTIPLSKNVGSVGYGGNINANLHVASNAKPKISGPQTDVGGESFGNR